MRSAVTPAACARRGRARAATPGPSWGPPWVALSLAGALALAGCGGEEDALVGPLRILPPHDDADASTLTAPPADVGALLQALARPHRDLRARLGPHRVRARLELDTDPGPQPPHPPLDEPVRTHIAVVDTLELDWGGGPLGAETFRVAQHNDQGRGRELIVIEDRAFTRADGRDWFVRPRQENEGETWLGELWRSAADAVRLAAPSLQVRPIASEPIGRRQTVGVRLSQSARFEPSYVPAEDRAQWRREMLIEAIDGEIIFDAETGAWLKARVDVEFSAGAPRSVRGHLVFAGEVEIHEDLRIEAPHEARPTPMRDRYEPERQALLDGLSGR